MEDERRARRDRSTTGAARRAKGCWWGVLTTDKGARRGVKQQRRSAPDRLTLSGAANLTDLHKNNGVL
jgi:hypothetical protein